MDHGPARSPGKYDYYRQKTPSTPRFEHSTLREVMPAQLHGLRLLGEPPGFAGCCAGALHHDIIDWLPCVAFCRFLWCLYPTTCDSSCFLHVFLCIPVVTPFCRFLRFPAPTPFFSLCDYCLLPSACLFIPTAVCLLCPLPPFLLCACSVFPYLSSSSLFAESETLVFRRTKLRAAGARLRFCSTRLHPGICHETDMAWPCSKRAPRPARLARVSMCACTDTHLSLAPSPSCSETRLSLSTRSEKTRGNISLSSEPTSSEVNLPPDSPANCSSWRRISSNNTI